MCYPYLLVESTLDTSGRVHARHLGQFATPVGSSVD